MKAFRSRVVVTAVLIAVIACAVFFNYFYSPVRITTALSRSAAAIGDPVTYTVDIVTDPDISLEASYAGGEFPGFDVIDKGVSSGRLLWKNRMLYWFTIASYAAGDYTIPRTEVFYTRDDGTRMRSETAPVSIRIRSILKDGEADKTFSSSIGMGTETHSVDTEIKFKIFDKKRPRAPVTISDIFTWLIQVSAILIAVIFIAYIALWISKRKPPPPSGYELAVQKLNELEVSLASRATDGSIREYYFALSAVVHHYLKVVLSLSSAERATKEFLGEIGTANLDGEAARDVESFVSLCDLVKFAGAAPAGADMKASIDQARSIIEKVNNAIAQNTKSENIS